MPITITMPALSPTMTEGTLAKWLLKEGDTVQSGDLLAEIETDKATMEVEAADDGVLARILVAEGTEGVPVNAPIAIFLEEGEDASVFEDATSETAAAAVAALAAPTPTQAPATEAVAVTAPAAAPPVAVAASGGRILASPLARRMATQAGLDLASVSGSGPRGRIVKADIEAAMATGGTPAAAPVAPVTATPAAPAADASALEGAFELQPLSTMRKTIARRMSESKREAPHFYLTVDCELDALLSLRTELNERADAAFKLSVNDLVIKAAAVALMKVPAANAGYSEDGIKLYKSADISVAVASERGLITPVIRNANGKGLEAISTEMRALAQKANDGKLMPEDYQGGSFSISNLGMYGVKQFDAVINTPQACILAVGAGEQRAVVKDGALAIATVMSVTLSVDHRAVDGAIGGQFLAAFKGLIQDPMTMLL
ncbi:MAG: pyruvate dehydrogenase complex dihydrolipoamide acetyltransferase [Alphaproteobacteria bacterium]|jgi:pyruvate dehydrogenase E2 component (dihydrolipoamide acetyltransferase)|nr:pyruvate dehydrogenase complex dihydrolipoamide acetyltransferase [Alphaproteobacteria bacterium]MDP6253696.1 pyruvate dehydrogenase complex dihydrolipoamide acetyltransferase [Alphaproteobacteria bacterium]MDP7055643.1 pyruvate dehydrogenase complex dihydrolipoamide acetyltransferase [Alphaproteobacteria bacterium]MDP7229277.1 pyruvate dehydrogenase complex dihydrolipoamide acetyltransferase [Alphaproteobacteria bacterium]MDP7460886.1 pyruvate dehydrogenase complex dihydrolipoamide acetyltr|tara:strand:+ start:1499 stop:2794 length:1296 start_codon:yes stop_codon:yes gene_type:complete